MATKRIFILVLLTLTILAAVKRTSGIINRNVIPRSKYTKGQYHLNTKKPLWILKDGQRKRGDNNGIRIPPTPPHYIQRQQLRRSPLKPEASRRAPPPQRQNNRRLHFMPQPIPLQSPKATMPTFDAMPGGEDGPMLGESAMPPIFIYNGPQGELIFNTMMRRPRYRMHEPVPGDILYPPATPMFRRRPIAQSYTAPTKQPPGQVGNFSFIPFYEHEAIPAPQFTTSPPSSALYALHKPPFQKDLFTPATTELPQRRGKSRYNAFRSAKEVHWRPPRVIPLRTTTPFPLTLANPLQNHRPFSITTTTTQEPLRNFQLSYTDDTESFRIVYLDEPDPQEQDQAIASSIIQPVKPQSSKVPQPKEYYALPVFTLGKLLKPERSEKTLKFAEIQNVNKSVGNNLPTNDEGGAVRNTTAQNGDGHAEDTWFILNSRYKGLARSDYRLSSKYVQTPKHHINDDSKDTTT